jgi:hypothetical protein
MIGIIGDHTLHVRPPWNDPGSDSYLLRSEYLDCAGIGIKSIFT